MTPFAPWKPDVGELGSGATVVATGVLPLVAGYGPWPAFVQRTAAAPEQPFGGTLTYAIDGTRPVFIGGATKLRKLNRSTLAFDNVSSGGGATNYNATADERWNFIQFGQNLIAHQINDVMQTINVDSGTNFANLGGTPPQARYGGVVKNFVVVGNTSVSPYKIRWSGSNNSAFWTVGQQQSDEQDFPDGGRVTGILGGETGFVFQEEAVRRMTYVGPPTIFQVDKIADKRGCKAPFSLVRAGDVAFYLSPEGFAMLALDGSGKLLDLGEWGEFFADDVAIATINRTRGTIDPVRSRVYWAYRSINAAANISFDTVLCWDYGLNRASICRVNLVEAIVGALGSTTLEGLDAISTSLDALGASLDDPQWELDALQYAIFDTTFKMGFFSGPPQEATLETADFELSPGRRSFVTGVRPAVDTDNVFISLGTRQLQSGTKSYTAETQPNARTGLCPFRSDSRYHSVKLRIPAGTTFTRISGYDPKFRTSGAA